ncbi:hypothetical protein TNCT_94341 [Trichonephila clavata]|uniref:Uncharacterized protein n=1 Tax=Trichonephila clavata TaxID=2740835 RepID=A0A8X6HSU4_TRICU|nr:hypothetical protein TNCT_94341 [Trichonephila clavata]
MSAKIRSDLDIDGSMLNKWVGNLLEKMCGAYAFPAKEKLAPHIKKSFNWRKKLAKEWRGNFLNIKSEETEIDII